MGNLTITSGQLSGSWEVGGNVTVSSGAAGGSAAITYTGTGTQTYADNSGTEPTGAVVIDKPSGIFSPTTTLTLNTSGQDLTLSGGTLHLNGQNLTVNDQFIVGSGTTFRLNGDETISGGPDIVYRGSTIHYDESSAESRLIDVPYWNLILGSTGTTVFNTPATAALTVSGSLTISGGTLTVTSGQTIYLSGSWLQSNTGAFSAGTGTVLLEGTSSALTLSGVTAFNNVTMDNGLVGYWRFDDGTGTQAKDGTLTNMSMAGWVATAPSLQFFNPYSLHLDGSDDYVDTGDIDSIDGGTAITVSTWEKWMGTANSVGTEARLMSKQQFGSDSNSLFAHGVGWDAANNKARFWVVVGGTFYNSGDSTTNVADGNWHLVTGVHDGAQIRIYVDGAQENATAQTGTLQASSPASVRIGNYNTNEYWNGQIDDVRIYKRALSLGEVQS